MAREATYTGVDTTLLSISFTSVNIGVAVGESGTIVVTADGGSTWQRSEAGTKSRLNAVDFAEDGVVWVEA